MTHASWCRTVLQIFFRVVLGALALGIAGLAGISANGQQSAAPPERIFGTYGTASAGRDSIRVLKRTNGKIGLIIQLYFANGHTCQLDSEGEWREQHIAVVTEGLEPSQPCRLNAFFKNGRVSLKDDGFQCTPVYCGTRGKLDGVSLLKSSGNRK